ncbi:apolipoprotein N-acyltransferase [Methylocaldum sp.]|uniref:apolipoprotein N-acyltransferase n=1 Tax=Methylocaldum sp. TaxID=1969727 RepID=UPI002D4CFEAB|nr:apolipoprotein N-acyltransferase [Methylocaldum sp.]HYE37853.1 apolipoprotein N-acyltransferase [Methylocaldum sp.]
MIYDILALLGGLLLPLAFAPFNYPVLAVAALLLLFAGWLNVLPRRAFLRGYLFGLGQYGLGVSWVYVSMHDYGGASLFEAAALTFVFTAFLALYPALAGWLSVRFFGGGRIYKLLVVFPAVWILVEWFRGWFLTGFPWLQIGYSQTDTPLAAYGPILGVYGIGWSLAFVAGGILAAFHSARKPRMIVAVAIISVLGLGGVLSGVSWTQPAGEPFKVTLLQGNVPQNMKWQPEFQRATLQMYTEMTRQSWDSRLIVWPETAIPAFYHQVKDTFLADLEAEAKASGTDLLIGVPFYDQVQDRYFNAVVALGKSPGVYFKRHLVPFGEYLPLRPVLGFVLDILEIPLSDFASGNGGQTPLVAAGHPLVASICYEDIFGQESLAGLPQAAYLVNVTNDAWFGDSIAPHQHVQMAKMRALETGRYMLRATNTGVTAIISPKGEITVAAPLFQRAQATGTITPIAGSTPYALWGDWPVVIALGLGLSLAAWHRSRRVRE